MFEKEVWSHNSYKILFVYPAVLCGCYCKSKLIITLKVEFGQNSLFVFNQNAMRPLLQLEI